jgi:MFS family permease
VDEPTADATVNAFRDNPAADGDGATDQAKPKAGLSGAFHRLFAAAVVSGIGDGLRYTALPLLAATISSSPNTVALVTAAGMVPWLLFGLPVGVLADRTDRRTLMWATDFVRAALVAGFAALVAVGHLSIWLLVVFAFIVGSAQVVFDTAAGAFLPAVVDQSQLGPANGRLLSAQTLTSQFIGPPIAGLLFAASAVWLFIGDAFSFLIAAVLVLTLRVAKRAPAASGGGSVISDILDGLRWLNRHRVLRDQSVLYLAMAFVSGALLGVFVLYVEQDLGLGGLGYGVLMACFALGNVAIAPMVPRLRAAVGDRIALVASVVTIVLTLVVLGTLPYPVASGLALFLFGAAVMTWMVITVTVRQELVPDRLLARVTSTYRMLGYAANPFGAVAGGLIAAASTIRTMLLIGAGGVVLSALLFRRGLDSQEVLDEPGQG